MHHYLRKVTALGFLASVIMGFALPSCGSRIGPVRASQSAGGIGRPNLPDIVLEHAKECVETYAQQMKPGQVVLASKVNVDEDRYKVGMTIDGIPDTAPDFRA